MRKQHKSNIRIKRRKDAYAVVRYKRRAIRVPPVITPTPKEKELKRRIIADATLKRDLSFLIGKGLDEWKLLALLTMAARARSVAQNWSKQYVDLPPKREAKADIKRLRRVADWIKTTNSKDWFSRGSTSSDYGSLPGAMNRWAASFEDRISSARAFNQHAVRPDTFERAAWTHLRDYVHSATGSYCQTRLPRLLNAALAIAKRGPITERAFLVRRLREIPQTSKVARD